MHLGRRDTMDRWEEPPIPKRLLVQLEDRRDLVDGEEFLGVCHERKAIGRGKRHLVEFAFSRLTQTGHGGARPAAERYGRTFVWRCCSRR